MSFRGLQVALAVSVCSALGVGAQAPRVLTADDYSRAERWMNYNANPLVQHTVGGVQYLADGRVFFRDPADGEVVYKVVDPKTGKVAAAFDNAKLGAALVEASKRAFEAKHLGINSFVPDEKGFTVGTAAGRFHCNVGGDRCEAPDGGGARRRGAGAPGGRRRGPADTSPNGQYAAFSRDHNLWVHVVATNEDKQLTTDGVKDYGYATDNAGWTHSDAPIVLWSADSKTIATYQQDQRKTGELYLVPVTNRHPKLEAWKYPLVGDQDVTTIERVVIDVASARVTRLKMPPDQHRSTICDDVSCRGGSGWDDVQFSNDGTKLAFVSSSRDHKDAWLRVADVATGEVKEIYHEHVPTYYESGQGRINWKYLPESNEFIWYSERDNWGQLYLYDLTTGKVKNAITHGDGPVTQVLHVDAKERVIYFLADGKEKGVDPYFDHYYRVGFDGKGQQLLTPEAANHVITPAPDGGTFVDVYSTKQTPAVAVVRDNTGKVLATLAKEDDAALRAKGWKPPVSITVKARDGKTELYGFMWKPTNFDAAKKYPLVDNVYPGPQEGSCPTRNFTTATRDNQSLADLGFIVICVDGMGTPWRSKSFHDTYAAPEKLGDGTIPDQVAAIKQLGAENSWIDMERVGVWGHSGGGEATASAMFHYPDFFKVGISESGNHDARMYEDDWDEKWGGLEKVADGKSNYDAQANQNWASKLKGHLLLAHGTMDDNVPPNNTLLVVDALIKANKDFDLIMIPNVHHGYAEASQYMMRRRWDYFVRYLAGEVPPHEYQTMPYDQTQKLINANGGPSDGVEDEE